MSAFIHVFKCCLKKPRKPDNANPKCQYISKRQIIKRFFSNTHLKVFKSIHFLIFVYHCQGRDLREKSELFAVLKEGHSVYSDLFETSIFPRWNHDIHLHIQACFKEVLRSDCTPSLRNVVLLCKYSSMIPHDPFAPINIFSKKETESFLKKYFLSSNNLMRFYIMAISNHAFGGPESIQLFHLLLDLCLSSNSSLLIFVRISGLDNSSFI